MSKVGSLAQPDVKAGLAQLDLVIAKPGGSAEQERLHAARALCRYRMALLSDRAVDAVHDRSFDRKPFVPSLHYAIRIGPRQRAMAAPCPRLRRH